MTPSLAPKKIGFIGLGLIGGSIAKAIRQYYPDCTLIAFDKNRETLAFAVSQGTIHISCSSIDDNFKHCDYIFLCAPIAYNTCLLYTSEDYICRTVPKLSPFLPARLLFLIQR